MSDKSKFEEYYQSSKCCLLPSEHDIAKIGWDACKKAILKELKGFEGEYVCDVIDKIKNI